MLCPECGIVVAPGPLRRRPVDGTKCADRGRHDSNSRHRLFGGLLLMMLHRLGARGTSPSPTAPTSRSTE